MTKIDIFSGFLGAGKTTLIKKLIKEAYAGEKLVLIENEFGEIGVDGGFLQEAGIKINELNSGCICCSLVGDFARALNKVYDEYHPDRILIEPSGVGKLSDVIRAVRDAGLENCVVNAYTAVVDANRCKTYMKNFGEFFNDQISTAACIVFSHTDVASADRLSEAVRLVKERNGEATIVTTHWDELDGKQILAAMEKSVTLESELAKLEEEEHEHGHCCHHHDHDDEEHEHGHCCHHHDHDDEEHEHGHCCHHGHDDEAHEHGHCHHEHEHGHHHDHHADEVFSSWGVETSKKFGADELEGMLAALGDTAKFGTVLRAKGIVAGKGGEWLHFDYIPEEVNVRTGGAAYTGRLCVIGAKLNEQALKELFLN
ncbi:MAG TPA: cobalamin biosynthesis protein CobW [Clostridiales bacterium]|nr:cobalamin biosynthesis protein CobW [Clostridiales bacterium]